jgi:hypothetical protein
MIIYQETWPNGRISSLQLTEASLTISTFKRIIIPIDRIRQVDLHKGFFTKELTVSYYDSQENFKTRSCAIAHIDRWHKAFQEVGITPNLPGTTI